MRSSSSATAPSSERGDRDADRAVRLVDIADRGHPRLALLTRAAVDQPGAAVVAGARVDLVELDQAQCSRSCRRQQDQDDDDDRDAPGTGRGLRIVHSADCSPVTSLPGRHGDDAAHEDVDRRGHREHEQDERGEVAWRRYLGFRQAKARRQTCPRAAAAASVAAIDAALAHRGERRRAVALGEAAAVGVRDQRMMVIGRLGRPSSACSRRWTASTAHRSAPRTTSSRPARHRRRRRRDDRRPAHPCGRGSRRRCRSASRRELRAVGFASTRAGRSIASAFADIEPPAMRRRSRAARGSSGRPRQVPG